MTDESMLKGRRRSQYPYFLSHCTRWSDNDQYAHVNNSIYYHLFDSIVNTYLIEHCGLSPTDSKQIGLVVSSWCQFFSPVSFPAVLDLGLRATKLGRSSVAYEVAVFEEGHDTPSAVGGYIHVFVDGATKKSVPMDLSFRHSLSQLFINGPGAAKL